MIYSTTQRDHLPQKVLMIADMEPFRDRLNGATLGSPNGARR